MRDEVTVAESNVPENSCIPSVVTTFLYGISSRREESSNRPLLCALPCSAIHHQVERLFTAGVKVPDTCLRALSDEALLLKNTVCMQRPH